MAGISTVFLMVTTLSPVTWSCWIWMSWKCRGRTSHNTRPGWQCTDDKMMVVIPRLYYDNTISMTCPQNNPWLCELLLNQPWPAIRPHSEDIVKKTLTETTPWHWWDLSSDTMTMLWIIPVPRPPWKCYDHTMIMLWILTVPRPHHATMTCNIPTPWQYCDQTCPQTSCEDLILWPLPPTVYRTEHTVGWVHGTLEKERKIGLS